MTPYQQSVEAANQWKMAVRKLWNTQLLITIFSLIAIASFIALLSVILYAPIGKGVAPITIFSVLFGIALLCTYVTQWVFVFDLRRWKKSAPVSFATYIRVLMICMITSLVCGILASFKLDDLNVLISNIAFVASVVQFVMFIKLKNDVEMPSDAKRGLRRIVAAYIVSVVGVIVGITFMVSAIIYHSDKSYMRIFVDEDFADDYEEYYEDMYDDDGDYLVASHGIMSGIIGDVSEEELVEMVDDFLAAKSVITLLVMGCIICAVASILYMILYLRGWYIISKSELPVLPESVESEECSTIY